MGVVTKNGGHPKNFSGAARRKPSFKFLATPLETIERFQDKKVDWFPNIKSK